MSKTPSLPSERVAWFDATFRPLVDFYLWCKEVDRKIKGAQSAISDLETTIAETVITDCWTDFVPVVVDGDIVVHQKLPFEATITSVVTDCVSGTCTVTGKIDGVSLGGSANSVSTTEVEQPHASANVGAVGTTVSYTVSANSNCTGMRVQFNYTRALG